MIRVLTAAALLLGCVVQSAHKDRAEQVKRMKQYETAHLEPVVVDENTMTMEFDAFEQHYEVELFRKIEAAASGVKHTNVEEEVHSVVSSVTESCYWQGTVTNFEGTSIVSASFCEGRGVRARVAAFDEILIIKPSAYYLDLAKDAAMDHLMGDEVLMYRLSDFDRPEIMGTEGVSDYVETDDVMMAEGEDMRRRLYSSSSPGNTEISVLIGPVRTANYQADYGSNWYSQLFHDTADMMNSVDAVYDATNWNANGRQSVGGAGSLRARFNEIHVIYAFTGSYASMAPTKRFSSCPLGSNQYDDSDECAIVGNHWLGLISNWVYNNMQSSQYDNVQMITDIKFNWNSCDYNGQSYVCSRTLGWGNIGVVCKGSSSVSTNSVVEEFGGNENAVGTIAHELGHNFGLYHDGQSGPAASCGANDGLMGYGNNHEEFSTCSLDGMEDYFTGNGNGMSCLGTGWSSSDGVTSNVADSGATVTSQPTASPVSSGSNTHSPTRSPVSTTTNGDCVHIEIGFSNSDGDWDAYANYEYNGDKAYYFYSNGDYYYLIKKELTWWGVTMKWVIVDDWDASSVYFFCTEDNLMSCGGQWKRWTSSGSYSYYPGSVINSQCTSSLNVDTSCASYDCLYVTGTGSFDGYYDATGECHDTKRVYSSSNGDYLCFADSYNRWFFSDEVCSLGSVISPETSDDPLSPEYWLVSDGGSSYTVTSDVYISDCDANGAFTGLECLDNTVYDDNVCVSNPGTLWDGDRTFAVYDELCANDQPVFHYVVYNESKAIQFGGTTLSEGVEATLYLHYQPQLLYSTDNETTPQWMISVDEISVNYLAVCFEEDLRDCSADKWTVRVTQFDADDSINGILVSFFDEHMTVSDGACSVGAGASDTSSSSTGTIIAVVVVLLVLMLCAVAFCIWFRNNKDDRMKMREQVHGQQSVPTGTGAEEAEADVEVATMAGHVTTTQD